MWRVSKFYAYLIPSSNINLRSARGQHMMYRFHQQQLLCLSWGLQRQPLDSRWCLLRAPALPALSQLGLGLDRTLGLLSHVLKLAKATRLLSLMFVADLTMICFVANILVQVLLHNPTWSSQNCSTGIPPGERLCLPQVGCRYLFFDLTSDLLVSDMCFVQPNVWSDV
jgi:hypothetical protein